MTTTPQEPTGDPEIVPSGEPQDPYLDPDAPDTQPDGQPALPGTDEGRREPAAD
jgi:hypothetical protein